MEAAHRAHHYQSSKQLVRVMGRAAWAKATLGQPGHPDR